MGIKSHDATNVSLRQRRFHLPHSFAMLPAFILNAPVPLIKDRPLRKSSGLSSNYHIHFKESTVYSSQLNGFALMFSSSSYISEPRKYFFGTFGFGSPLASASIPAFTLSGEAGSS